MRAGCGGEIVAEEVIVNTREVLIAFSARYPRATIVMETGRIVRLAAVEVHLALTAAFGHRHRRGILVDIQAHVFIQLSSWVCLRFGLFRLLFSLHPQPCGSVLQRVPAARSRSYSVSAMNLAACVVIIGFALFLFGLTAIVFAKPVLAERFFRGFASSARTHIAEQSLRLMVGVALVVRSPEMWRSGLFLIIGWALLGSAAALLILPWRWHYQLGVRVLPMVVRHMKFYAIGMFAFGSLLLYGLFVPLLPSHGG